MNVSTVRQHTDVLYLNSSVPTGTKRGRCWNHWCMLHLPAFVSCHPMYDTSEAMPPSVVCICGLATALNFSSHPLLPRPQPGYCSLCVPTDAAGERSRAELPDALAWLEAVGPARRAHCMGSVFQEGREEQGFKLPDILMLQIAVWFTGLLLSPVRCTIISTVSKTEWDVNSPLPPPLQTSGKLCPKALTEQTAAGVISSHTESQCGLDIRPELWRNHLPLNLTTCANKVIEWSWPFSVNFFCVFHSLKMQF